MKKHNRCDSSDCTEKVAIDGVPVSSVVVMATWYVKITEHDAALPATWEYFNRMYTFSSNRFVSAMLEAVGTTLTSKQ